MQWVDQNCWNSSCEREGWLQQLAFMCFHSTTAAKKRWRCLISSWWNGKFVHQCGVRDRGYLRLNTCDLLTHLCANAQRGQYISAIGTVTMATAATQLGHLTFLTDSSVLLFPPDKQATPPAQRHLFPPSLSHSSFLGYSSFPSLSFPVNHKVLSLMGGLPISITLGMLSFQLNSAEVQVIKAGAYCVHPPCAANDIIKYSWRGKPVMISVKNVSFISFEVFSPSLQQNPQFPRSFLCSCLKQSRRAG